MAGVVNVETRPDDTREQRVVLLHKLGKTRLVFLADNQDKIKRPMILACTNCQLKYYYVSYQTSDLLGNLPTLAA